jgi:uncharacterized protein
MPNSRNPFRLNVGFIVHEEVGFSREFPFEFNRVQIGDDLLLTDLNGMATIGRTPQGLLVQGRFGAQIELECARCLTAFWRRIDWGLTELFAFNRSGVSDSGLLLPEDAHIDLGPLLREYALLEVPISPLHAVDCRGLCPVCGQDRNVRDCGHQPPEPESPFSALKGMSR